MLGCWWETHRCLSSFLSFLLSIYEYLLPTQYSIQYHPQGHQTTPWSYIRARPTGAAQHLGLLVDGSLHSDVLYADACRLGAFFCILFLTLYLISSLHFFSFSCLFIAPSCFLLCGWMHRNVDGCQFATPALVIIFLLLYFLLFLLHRRLSLHFSLHYSLPSLLTLDLLLYSPNPRIECQWRPASGDAHPPASCRVDVDRNWCLLLVWYRFQCLIW